MKKPIDPNLGNSQNSELDFMSGESFHDKNSFVAPDVSDIDDEITDLLQSNESSDELDYSDTFELTTSENIGSTKRRYHHHHHHHSSSSSHSDGSSHSDSHHHNSSHSGSHHSSSHSSSHHHSSSHRHHHHHKKKKPLALRILAVVLAVILIITAVSAATFYTLKVTGEKDIKNTTTTAESEDYREQIEYNGHTYILNENVVSVAFIGVDRRDMEEAEKTDFAGSADADIVLAIDTSTGKADAIAVPRDTMVDVAQYDDDGEFIKTSSVQLCLAYAYAGGGAKSCENVVSSISKILYNIPIEKYYALDLDGIKPLNDAVGGVTLTALYDLPDYGITKGEEVTLKGDMAEAYVRTRDMDKLTASLNRTDRQIQYVKAYASKVRTAVSNDFSVVSDLYSTAAEYSQTNLKLSNLTYIAATLLSKGIDDVETHSISGEMKGATATEFPDSVHAEFYPDDDSLMQTVLSIYYDCVD